MSKDADGRFHVESMLMRESLVDRRVLARTRNAREFEILPEVVLVGIGGQSIFDRGKAALLPIAEELGEARAKQKIIVGVGGGTRVRHTLSIAVDLGLPTGGIAPPSSARVRLAIEPPTTFWLRLSSISSFV